MKCGAKGNQRAAVVARAGERRAVLTSQVRGIGGMLTGLVYCTQKSVLNSFFAPPQWGGLDLYSIQAVDTGSSNRGCARLGGAVAPPLVRFLG